MVVGYVFPTSAPKTAPQYLEGERGYVPSKFGQESSPFLPPRLQQLPWSLFPWETNRPGVTPGRSGRSSAKFFRECAPGVGPRLVKTASALLYPPSNGAQVSRMCQMPNSADRPGVTPGRSGRSCAKFSGNVLQG